MDSMVAFVKALIKAGISKKLLTLGKYGSNGGIDLEAGLNRFKAVIIISL